eukprot:11156397-Lingulodinium_polyedra.AAC.1
MRPAPVVAPPSLGRHACTADQQLSLWKAALNDLERPTNRRSAPLSESHLFHSAGRRNQRCNLASQRRRQAVR